MDSRASSSQRLKENVGVPPLKVRRCDMKNRLKSHNDTLILIKRVRSSGHAIWHKEIVSPLLLCFKFPRSSPMTPENDLIKSGHFPGSYSIQLLSHGLGQVRGNETLSWHYKWTHLWHDPQDPTFPQTTKTFNPSLKFSTLPSILTHKLGSGLPSQPRFLARRNILIKPSPPIRLSPHKFGIAERVSISASTFIVRWVGVTPIPRDFGGTDTCYQACHNSTPDPRDTGPVLIKSHPLDWPLWKIIRTRESLSSWRWGLGPNK